MNYDVKTLTKPYKAFQNKVFVEKAVQQLIEPKLFFKDLFDVVDLEGAKTFKTFQELDSAEKDIQNSILGTPVDITETSDISQVVVSDFDEEIGGVKRFGSRLVYSPELAKDEVSYANNLKTKFNKVVYSIARRTNAKVFETMDAEASAKPIDLNDGEWINSSKISKDLLHMKRNFEADESYDYELTDILLNAFQYYNLNDWYDTTRNGFDPNNIEGITASNMKGRMPDDILFGLDRNEKPITIYKNRIANMNQFDSFINTSIYTEPKYPFLTTIDFVAEIGISCTKPNAILKQTGLGINPEA